MKEYMTSVFIAALFTIVQVWKKPECPSTDEGIKKMWCVCVFIYVYVDTYTYMCTHIGVHTHIYINTMEYYSSINQK